MKMIRKSAFVAMAAMLLVGCKAGKYPDLSDGIYADIQTSKGDILVKLNYEQTPVTVANFITLAQGKNGFVENDRKNKPYYDGTIFHRVISEFMIQGGDPTGTGAGSPGYTFEDEIVDSLKHDKGVISMANAGKNTNGSQFFITQVETPWLDGRHTVFGKVIKGINVVDSIAEVKVDGRSKPEQDVKINKVDIIVKGKSARSFDAQKVFENYMKNREEVARQKEEQVKAQAAKTKTLFDEQRQKAEKTPSGLKIFTIKKGDGKKIGNDKKAMVRYAGYFTDGSLFDTNSKEIAKVYAQYDIMRDKQGGYEVFPMEFNESIQVIPGFKEALLKMTNGEHIRVFIPSALGYGEHGAGNVIPPNTDLVFDIAIEGVQ